MKIKRYVQPGSAIDYKNPSASADIEPGTVVTLGTRVGVCAAGIPKGGAGVLNLNGVYELPKDTAAIDLGAIVYMSADAVTATAGDVVVGRAVAAATAADSVARVLLLDAAHVVAAEDAPGSGTD